MAKSHKRLMVVIVLLVCGVGGWWWLRPGSHHLPGTSNTARPVAVATLQVKLLDAQSFNEFAGTVQSSVTVQLSARLVAHVQEVAVHAGALVKKGDLLVRLDDGDIRARMKQAQSALTAAEASRDEAQKDFLRYQELFKNSIASRQQLEQAEARAKNTLAAVESARQQLMEVKENIGYTEIRTPFDAVVVEKFADPGDLASPGRVLLTLQDPSRLRLEAPISEQCARKIRIGDPATATVASAEAELQTMVSEIVPAVDPKSRAFLVRTNLPNHADIKPGMFGRLRFPCAPRKLLALPRTAVVSRGQLDFVFVVSEQKARLRLVRLGDELQDKVEILSGLTAGEIVVARLPENLHDGDPVTLLTEERQ